LLRDARLISALLADPQRTAFVIVTLPAELPADETVELARAARLELGVPLGPVIVNAVPPARLATEPVASLLDRLGAASDDRLLARTLAMAAGQRAHVETANEVRAALAREPGLPMVPLPWLPSTDLGPREIEQLSAALVASPEVVAR
jgi:hypothetical protein